MPVIPIRVACYISRYFKTIITYQLHVAIMTLIFLAMQHESIGMALVWVASTTQADVQYIDGLMQDCSISIANALDMLQSCPKPSICFLTNMKA